MRHQGTHYVHATRVAEILVVRNSLKNKKYVVYPSHLYAIRPQPVFYGQKLEEFTAGCSASFKKDFSGYKRGRINQKSYQAAA